MRKLSYSEKDDFQARIIDQIPNLLDDALDWIKTNLEPEDVFETDVLIGWANDNGYIKEE